MTIYENLQLDEERALYGISDAQVRNCTFDGPADGESALKESSNIRVADSRFHLRYPFWHVTNAYLESCRMSDGCRAAFWYDRHIHLKNCRLDGIKAVRECSDFTLEGCEINSPEFGWLSKQGVMRNCGLSSEYPFFYSRDLKLYDFKLTGKYSFQYVDGVEIRDSYLDTKDAFWHAKNVTVYNSVVKGEYLGWYSHNLTLIDCKIIGTQPLCYAENLVLKNCEMIDCDLSFENSVVDADIRGEILSVKNPRNGRIVADGFGEIISDEHGHGNRCRIELRDGAQCHKSGACGDREKTLCHRH